MNTTKNLLDHLELAQEHYKARKWYQTISLSGRWTVKMLYMLCERILSLEQQVQSLSTQITSATSDSGTGTEGLKFPTGTLGGSQAKSTPAEPTGSDGPSMGESSGNE